jgi:hypothetical protein
MRRIMALFGVELYGFFARVPGPGEPLDTIAFNKHVPQLADWLKLYKGFTISSRTTVARSRIASAC